MTYSSDTQRRYRQRVRQRKRAERVNKRLVINAKITYRGLEVIAETLEDLDRLVNHIREKAS